jgi:DNA-binding NarL/FixJ family response regulator
VACCGGWTPERLSALEALRAAGFSVETCGGTCPIECVIERPPDVLIYAVDPARDWECAALRMVKRLHPLLPLVVVTSDGSVDERLRFDPLRPAYVAVDPVDPDELADAVHALIGRDMRCASHLSRWRRTPRGGPSHRST